MNTAVGSELGVGRRNSSRGVSGARGQGQEAHLGGTSLLCHDPTEGEVGGTLHQYLPWEMTEKTGLWEKGWGGKGSELAAFWMPALC